jgi:hypothetical protein
MRNANPFNSPTSLVNLGARLLLPLVFLAAALGGILALAAQAQATAAPSATTHKAVHRHKHPIAAKQQPTTPQIAPVVVTPPEPELPHWPVNEQALPATVTWNSLGLRIEAANSSLQQILKDVATATGAKLEGMTTDERVFGAFGPGQAHDVLSQLLQGTSYNIVMIGDQGQGTPREIVLSSRHAGSTTTTTNSAPAGDDDADTEEPPVQLPVRPSPGPGGARTPQQINQDMQQRQQEMEQRRQQLQQQQQQQPNNP